MAAAAQRSVAAARYSPVVPKRVRLPVHSRIAATDLTIEQLWAEQVGRSIQFTVEYASGRDRDMEVFDPPKGQAIRLQERGTMKASGHEAAFRIPLDKMHRFTTLAVRFAARDERDLNEIVVDFEEPSVRKIFGDRRVRTAGASPSSAIEKITAVKAGDDVRRKDVSGLATLTPAVMRTLWFHDTSSWKGQNALLAKTMLEAAKNPGLGVRRLHAQGITGKGVRVAIIDQPLRNKHPEYARKIVAYHDVGCGPGWSMHGPAVASLLVGTQCGTAPDAEVYYVAAPSWKQDARDAAAALDWIIAQNAKLPDGQKIRAVSVSATLSGVALRPFKNGEAWDAAWDRATKAGVLVVDATRHHGFVGPCYLDDDDPENPAKCTPIRSRGNPTRFAEMVLAPVSPRTSAVEQDSSRAAFQFTGIREEIDDAFGSSWSMPYATGVLALGWQVNPRLSPGQMIALLKQSAFRIDGHYIINPPAFIDLVKQQ